MELAEGGSVADLVAHAGPRSFDEVAPQVDMILDALVAAHGHSIVHRDLKPENVLIDRYRRWRITDFGIANVTGEEVAGSTGTPAFAAPEQLLGEPHGPQADLYAVAGIVVFALTGEPPFGDGEPQEIVARQLAGKYPTAVCNWLRTALASSPDDRFADAVAMKEAWRKAVRTSLKREGAWWRKSAAR